MKIEKILLADHQIQLNVEVDEETFEKSKKRAARKISRNRRIPGFRAGKAPYQVVVRHVGEAAVIEEALEFLVDDIYPVLLEKEEVAPYGPGQLKEVKSLAPPLLEFVIPLAPEVDLGDYQKIQKEYEIPEVTDSQVDETVENLRSRQAKTEPVERAAEVGDLLQISLRAADKNAEEDEEPIFELKQTPVVVEDADVDTESEWPFPGFSHGLAGLSKDEDITLEHDYDEDYSDDDRLTGKSVVFTVTIHEVQSRELPELTDEFAKSIGEYESVDELRADARKHLEESSKENYHSDYENSLLDEVVEMSEFRFPPQMVDDEVDALLDQFKNRLANDGWDMETYLKANEKDEESLREEFQETAERRIRRGLAIMDIAQKEDIKVSEKDVQQDVQRTVDMVNSSFPPAERRKILTEDMLRGLVSSAMRDTLTQRTFARIKAIANNEIEEEDNAEETVETSPKETTSAEAVELVESIEETDAGEESQPEAEESETPKGKE